MHQFFIFFLSSFISVIVQIYGIKKISNAKVLEDKKKSLFTVIVVSILISILYAISDSFVRVILTFGLMIIANYILFGMPWRKTSIATFLMNTVFAVSEIIFSLFVIFILKLDIESFGENFFGKLSLNILVSCIVIVLLKLPFLFSFLKKIISIDLNQSIVNFVVFAGVIISAVSMYSCYFKLGTAELLFIILLYIIIYMFIVFKLFNEKNERQIAESKNNSLVEHLSEYEKIIDFQKIEAHENKNQLRIIKEMIGEENKELKAYIDNILNEYKEKDKEFLNQVKDIPNGTISALIYSKLVGLSKNYKINLIISKSVTIKSLSNISAETNVDICKILGVFLDNAIEAADLTQEKLLGIELFVENNSLKIIISNSFSGIIEIDRIDEIKYSTKGSNRGYGLALVKKILGSNLLLKNTKKINNNIFSQVLVVDLENKKTKN